MQQRAKCTSGLTMHTNAQDQNAGNFTRILLGELITYNVDDDDYAMYEYIQPMQCHGMPWNGRGTSGRAKLKNE